MNEPGEVDESASQISRTDRLVEGTVNASISEHVRASELAAWIREQTAQSPRARVGLSIFFLEVPLATQVAFLRERALDEDRAVAFAERLEHLGRPLPLAARRAW